MGSICSSRFAEDPDILRFLFGPVSFDVLYCPRTSDNTRGHFVKSMKSVVIRKICGY